METAPVELVVIGAGWHGLVSAKTYLEVNPSARVIILDKSPTIGGVWAQHRLYPGLNTNNMLGTYEFSDFPMTDDHAFGVKSGEHIPGHVVHEYLKSYAEKYDILKLCRFSEDVKTAEKLDGAGWTLTVEKSGGETYKLTTSKLVVATGLTSEPFLPDFEGADEFGAPIIHCGNLRQHSEALFAEATNVVVFGGTKSAWDAAYAFATRGVHVDWVIRESGHGPVWMSPPYVTPLKKWLEKLVTTRFLTWFSPCIWSGADGFNITRGFLHGTAIGRLITRRFWAVLGGDVIYLNGYDKHPETAKLKPWVDAFWVAAGLSILNYPTNFFDLVKEGKISVHIRDVTKLTSKTVHLSPSASSEESITSIRADALICSTGWKFHPPMNFVSPDGKKIDTKLGLPHHSKEPASNDPIVQQADSEILSRFPILQNQPKINPKLTPLSNTTDLNRGFSLYRFMVPPALIHERTIAFNGMVQTISTSMIAQAQALWITAYLDGKLPMLNGDSKTLEDQVVRETTLHARFGRWRYPGGYGARYPDFVFDAMPYIDLLLGDLGLNTRRKQGLVSECFEPYGPADYVGLVEEWKKTQA
ncbi:FAD/NAD(P)-binding domain-containing protein [Wilcoxina mikolae CBS 423.85]|nr:FAD/NAD(P)-binding domain-containing protein [Wilcoxina mikolae CBS 423.85]